MAQNCHFQLSRETEAALGVVLNLARRHLSFEQIREIHERLRRDRELRKQVAIELRKQGRTQEEVAAIVGVAQQTVSEWEKSISDTEIGKANTSDLRYKIPKGAQEEIYKRYKSGESQKKLAVEFKISQGRVSQIVKKIEREKERAAKEAEEVKRAEVEAVVVHADALKWLHTLEASSLLAY